MPRHAGPPQCPHRRCSHRRRRPAGPGARPHRHRRLHPLAAAGPGGARRPALSGDGPPAAPRGGRSDGRASASSTRRRSGALSDSSSVLPRRLARGDVDLLWSPLITLPLRCPVPAGHGARPDGDAAAGDAYVESEVEPPPLPAPLLRSGAAAGDHLPVDGGTIFAFHFPQCPEKIRVVYPGIDPDSSPGIRRRWRPPGRSWERRRGTSSTWGPWSRARTWHSDRRLGDAAGGQPAPLPLVSPAPTAGGASGWRGASRPWRPQGSSPWDGSSGRDWCGCSRPPASSSIPRSGVRLPRRRRRWPAACRWWP